MNQEIRDKINAAKAEVEKAMEDLRGTVVPVAVSAKDRIFLGDGLYAQDQGNQIELSTESALKGGSQRVYLDDGVVMAFLEFLATTRKIKIEVWLGDITLQYGKRP